MADYVELMTFDYSGKLDVLSNNDYIRTARSDCLVLLSFMVGNPTNYISQIL